MNQLHNMKVRIEGLVHSNKIQKELIRLGFRWVYHSDSIVHQSEPFLFARVYNMTISFSPYNEAFEKYTDYTETTLEELKLM